MKAEFTPVPKDWSRQPYFDYYWNKIESKYSLNYQLEITAMFAEIKKRKLRFYPTMIYLIMRVINQNEEFRLSFNSNKQLGIWNFCNPSYTIFNEEDKSFSDIWTPYHSSYSAFYAAATEDMERYKGIKQIKAKPNQPANFTPISCLPWLSYSSLSLTSSPDSTLLYPLIQFGKFYLENEKQLMPFSVFVNHAIADGYHVAKLINEVEELCQNPSQWINS